MYTKSQETADDASKLWNAVLPCTGRNSLESEPGEGTAVDAVRNESCGGCTVDRPTWGGINFCYDQSPNVSITSYWPV